MNSFNLIGRDSCPATPPKPDFVTASALAWAAGSNITNTTDILSGCCTSSSVVPYNNSCYLFCETGGDNSGTTACMVNYTGWVTFYENDVWKPSGAIRLDRVSNLMGLTVLVALTSGAFAWMF